MHDQQSEKGTSLIEAPFFALQFKFVCIMVARPY